MASEDEIHDGTDNMVTCEDVYDSIVHHNEGLRVWQEPAIIDSVLHTAASNLHAEEQVC